MRTVEESRKRWDTLFSNNERLSDLKRALKSDDQSYRYDNSLRSVCWKAFLLYDNLDRSEYPPRISDSRSAYSALRDHFLKYIEHPDDLPSTVDPLAEDEESPWQSLRRDEAIRAEIYQDVERCMQENFFFREPSTKAKMLDILFIYSKLNPDLGYRQGMHELLAPVLWVLDRDAIDKRSLESADTNQEYDDLMLQLLDATYIEHDSFTLFCAIMQTVRVYYEPGDQRSGTGQVDVAPIVGRCQHIHEDLLVVADEELADHLHAIEILPQIFITRWIRLLFGREFSFEDVLSVWDLLFAEDLRLELIDLICVAMLLRIRWQLLEADYPTALSLLLRYPSPHPHAPRTFVQDALYLEQNPTNERGAFIISKYSGRPPETTRRPLQAHLKPTPGKRGPPRSDSRSISESSSPGRSPGSSNQKNLETLFQDVSEGFQRRTEAWGVAKAVRGAVTEARRNIQTIQSNATSPISRPRDSPSFGSVSPPQGRAPNVTELNKKIQLLEDRNKILSRMLGDALHDLCSRQEDCKSPADDKSNEAFDQALAKIRAVQTHLDDSSTPIVPAGLSQDAGVEATNNRAILQKQGEDRVRQAPPRSNMQATNVDRGTPTTSMGSGNGGKDVVMSPTARPLQPVPLRPATRQALAESEFSWMLGDKRHHSSFASSASVPPEQSRHSDSKAKQNPLFGDARGEEARRKSTVEDDGVLLSSLRATNGRR